MKGGMLDRIDAGGRKEGSGKGGMQERRDARKEGCQKGGIQEGRDEGNEDTGESVFLARVETPNLVPTTKMSLNNDKKNKVYNFKELPHLINKKDF